VNSEPLIYEKELDIHFSFLDQYNHVNAKHYLDLVASSRLIYLERDMKMPLDKLMEQGIGFYLKTATQNFKRPIVGLDRVRIRSYVVAIRGVYLGFNLRQLVRSQRPGTKKAA
jgi:acyl-CoA thioesterase FadM